MITIESTIWDAFGLSEIRCEHLSGGRVHQVWRCGSWVIKRYDVDVIKPSRIERALRLQAACAAAGLPVPAPRLTVWGDVWLSQADGAVAVFPFIAGVRRSRGSLTVQEATLLGRLAARLHRVLGAQLFSEN